MGQILPLSYTTNTTITKCMCVLSLVTLLQLSDAELQIVKNHDSSANNHSASSILQSAHE
jgi:hypothetical protein